MAVVVVNANCSEQAGGVLSVVMLKPNQAAALKLIWVDPGFQGVNFARNVQHLYGATVEVVKRSDAGFVILPKRWCRRTDVWLAQSEPSSQQGL